MKYYIYKTTFKDLPKYFYYGVHKHNGQPYFGSPKTWKNLWDQFEPESQILQWFDTYEKACIAERKIIKATWKDPHSLNENCGGMFSEESRKKPKSSEHKAKISEAIRILYLDPQQKENHSQTMMGNKNSQSLRSPESRARHSQIMKEAWARRKAKSKE